MDKPKDILDIGIATKRYTATTSKLLYDSLYAALNIPKPDPFIERIIAIRKEHGIPDPRPEKIFEGGQMLASNISWDGGEMANEDKD